MLAKAVGVGPLGGDHEDVALLDAFSPEGVAPDIVGRTEGPQDMAGRFGEGRPGQVQDGEIVAFKPLPADRIGAGIGDDEIRRLFVYHGYQQVHGIIADPSAGLKADPALDFWKDVLGNSPPDLFGK